MIEQLKNAPQWAKLVLAVIGVVIVLSIIGAVTGCGGEDGNQSASPAAPTTTEQSRTSSQPSTPATPEPTEAPYYFFELSSVRAEATAGGEIAEGLRIKVFVVETRPSADYEEIAQLCARHYLGEYYDSQCFVFSSQEQYNYSQVDASSYSGGMKNLCYEYAADISLDRTTFNVIDGSEYHVAYGCP